MKVLLWLTLGATAVGLGVSRAPAHSPSVLNTPLFALASPQGDGVGCNPCIDVIVKCTDGTSGGGIAFQGRVKNCGDVDLLDVVVTHDNGTANPSDDVVVLALPSLAPGVNEGFTGTYAPSVAPGQPSTLVVDGIGTPPAGCALEPVSSQSSATCLAACAPCLELILKCTDAAKGEGIPFIGRVGNCGNVDLTNVVVMHDNGTPLDPSDDVVAASVPLLTPGELSAFSGTYDPSVPPGEASTLVGSAIATPPADCGLQDVTATQSTTCLSSCSPCIDVVLKCQDAPEGGPIPFQGRVKNCGDVDLFNVMVAHDNGTPGLTGDDVLVTTVPVLAPGELHGFAGSYTPSVPLGTPSTLTATAVATAPEACGGGDLSASGTATCSQLPGNAGEGCTPGFWKNHPELWDEAGDPFAAAAGFTTGTGFNAFFGLTAAESGFPDSLTMLDAVKQGGGGGAKLGRHGVSALLNVAAGLDYDMPDGITTAAELVAAIQNAYLTDVFEPLASQIADGNEGDCPF